MTLGDVVLLLMLWGFFQIPTRRTRKFVRTVPVHHPQYFNHFVK